MARGPHPLLPPVTPPRPPNLLHGDLEQHGGDGQRRPRPPLIRHVTLSSNGRSTGKYRRELFGKKYGHKEWVSTCAYSNGKVISGAMDSMVCVWDAVGVRCDHFAGHQYEWGFMQGEY